MPGVAVVGAYPMTGADCARTVVPRSVGRCLDLGAVLRPAGEAPTGSPPGTDVTATEAAEPDHADHADDAGGTDDVADLLAALDVRPLLTGRVVHVARTGGSGPPRGTVTVQGDGPAPRTLWVDFQDGNLVAAEDGVVRATVPDLICLVDADSWRPVHTARLSPDQRIRVLVIEADRRWHGLIGLLAAGPRSFGYDIDHEPLGGGRTVRC
ncbi:MAG TPA: hypothetical protein VGD67_00660, partial [Pseudonocardiaceae bacterium]